MKRVTLPGTSVLDLERTVELELEHADTTLVRDPLHLRAQRPVALARDVLHVLEEVAVLDPCDELGSVRNQYSTPSVSPGRCGRVVAEIATSSTGTRSTSALISVPLPAPDGPVMTNTGALRTG